MPMNTGRMKHLQVLTRFYVGKQNRFNVWELENLNYLLDSLKISKLDNINDQMDAEDANMKEKNYLNELILKWSGNNDDSQNERSVLEVFQPHRNLKGLVIRNYCGTRFADWMGAPYLLNLVSLELMTCKYCFCLPPVGQEFYGQNLSIAPFLSLKYLKIEDMWELEEWKHFEGECFPRLNAIYIRRCSKLEWIFLSKMTHLKSLHEDMHAQLPCLHSLWLYGCPQLQLVPQRRFPLSLVKITINDYLKLIASHMSWGLHRLHSLQDLYVGCHDFENAKSFLEE
ncbi:putative disease resistance RPP13-like protein 1 [Prosopis cineraria]|uniref:putative disease resistance RPP13-like protein 1 n=1 Tax=Prosopis cineraria TaxID=364024 RepID=UPI0024105646|nr:putative disease resistance RPP13-like protein 1 [Prosopis cineraria]